MRSTTLRLPATSANLGPGFDALGLAMSLFLTVSATAGEQTSIIATGRDAALVGSLEDNLIIQTVRTLAPEAPALQLQIHNEIPLGMGCGSSAAALLAGVHLANHFGGLGMSPLQVLAEACAREGHPDNVAACFYGGFTVSAMQGREVITATFSGNSRWRLFLALPPACLSTRKARALLPDRYPRADAVANIQSTALLVAAFAQNRPELLVSSTRDRIHQPYRAEVCPLLPLLLPIAGRAGVHSVTLSGAGPSVLLIADESTDSGSIVALIRSAAADSTLEVVETSIHTAEGGTLYSAESA